MAGLVKEYNKKTIKELKSQQKISINNSLMQLRNVNLSSVIYDNKETSMPIVLQNIIDKFENAKGSIEREIFLEVTKTLNIHYKDGSVVFIDQNMQKKSGNNLTKKLSKNSPTSSSGEMNYSFFISCPQTIDILYKD